MIRLYQGPRPHTLLVGCHQQSQHHHQVSCLDVIRQVCWDNRLARIFNKSSLTSMNYVSVFRSSFLIHCETELTVRWLSKTHTRWLASWYWHIETKQGSVWPNRGYMAACIHLKHFCCQRKSIRVGLQFGGLVPFDIDEALNPEQFMGIWQNLVNTPTTS